MFYFQVSILTVVLSWMMMMMHHGCFQVSFSTALAPRVSSVDDKNSQGVSDK
jgi:peptidoglycan biosynthesis protein MviN/MurJ (putative lipid II flippase)